MLSNNDNNELLTKKINVFLLGSCGQGKNTFLNRIEQEQLLIERDSKVIEADSDNYDDEEIYDNFQDRMNLQKQNLISQFKINDTKLTFQNSFQENSEWINSFQIFLQSSYFEVLALVISAKAGLFELAQGYNCDCLQVSKLSYNVKILFLITNMGSINWNNERYDQVVYFIKNKIIVPLKLKNFSIIPIDSIQGFNISQPIPISICKWYKGQTLIQTLETLKFENSGRLQIKVISQVKFFSNNNNTQMNHYLCKVLTGATNKLSYPFTFNIDKSSLIVNQIYDITQVPVNFLLMNDIIYIELQKEQQVPIGIIISDDYGCQFVKSQEIMAEVQLFQLQKSILTLGYFGKLQLIGQIIEFEIISVEYVVDEQQKKTKRNFLKSNENGGIKLKFAHPICIEKYENNERLGSFLILAEDSTLLGLGKILKIKTF